jgi:Sec-independent protein translocase protein TatA
MFSLGGSEILVLAFIALILFGNKNLPQTMKKMVKGLNEVKKVANEAQRSWTEVRDDLTRQVMLEEAEDEARKQLSEIKKALDQKESLKQDGGGDDSSVDTTAAHSDSPEQTQLELPTVKPPPDGEALARAPASRVDSDESEGEPYYENPEDDPRPILAATTQDSANPSVPDASASDHPSPEPAEKKHTDT